MIGDRRAHHVLHQRHPGRQRRRGPADHHRQRIMVAVGRVQDADIVIAGLDAAQHLAGAGLVRDRPARREAAAQPLRAGMGLGHDREQPLGRFAREQFAALQPGEAGGDPVRRRAVDRIVDIALERLAAPVDRDAVARLVEGVALRRRPAAIAGRRCRSAAAARRGRSGCRRGGCARASRAPPPGPPARRSTCRCRYCRSGSARGTSARRASSYSRSAPIWRGDRLVEQGEVLAGEGDALVEVELAGVGALEGGDRHPEFADALLRDRNGRRASWWSSRSSMSRTAMPTSPSKPRPSSRMRASSSRWAAAFARGRVAAPAAAPTAPAEMHPASAIAASPTNLNLRARPPALTCFLPNAFNPKAFTLGTRAFLSA